MNLQTQIPSHEALEYPQPRLRTGPPRQGYNEEYGARNLERVMDRLPGSLIAEALLSGKITAGQTIRLEANGYQLQDYATTPQPAP